MVAGRGRWFVAIAAVAAVAVAAAAFIVVNQQRQEAARDDAARAAVEAFASAWESGDVAPLAFTGTEGAAVQEQLTAATTGMDGAGVSVDVGPVSRDDGIATAPLRVSWAVTDAPFSYDSVVGVTETADGDWSVDFAPSVVHPDLTDPADILDATREAADRGDVLGRDGAVVVGNQPVVEVGVQPSRATDAAALAQSLADLLDVDAAALAARIAAADPEAFVPVVTLRQGDYDELADRLQPLAGTVFRESTLPLAPTREFARALLGTVGPATAEIVEASQGRLAAGDVTGLSGLQRTYDERLGGTPGVRVERVRADERTELFVVSPVPGEPLQLTLETPVQQAADAALAGAAGDNAALVAIDVPSGDVLAVANTPASGVDRALTGQYPPGSTFKTVAALALLAAGVTPDQVVPCPPTATVDGRSFRNFEGGSGGDLPFSADFAQSCNTAFVGLSQQLAPEALQAAAAAVGLGGDWSVGTDAFTGSVPVTESAVDLAASTIGQGRVLASPLAMAQAVAAIARGSWAPPVLVVDPPVEAAAPAPAPVADLAVVADLMRGVVESGTAAALADVPGAPVHAKTGTAEYGTGSPPPTHAWTVGYAGDLAFAVLVEDGASGGEVAVPVAEAFLRALPTS